MLMKFKKLALSIGVVGLMMATGVLAKPVLVKSQNHIEEYRLDNGLRVILAPNEKESKVYMNMVYFTGSLDDPQGKGGLAHLLEHLAFKGTKNIPEDEFQRRLDQYTLMNNAMTSFDYTSYINVLPAEQKNINELLFLEAERMDKSIIKMEHVPNEIEIVKREREIRLDQPFSVVHDQIFKELYGNQSLGREPIGDLEELKSINLNELQQFYQTWYKPNNSALIMTGKFDKAETLKAIEQHFAPIQPATQFPTRANTKIPALDMSKLKNREFSVQKGSQSMTYVGYLGDKNVEIQNKLSVADTLFSMEPSGRLYQHLIKNKKAIDVGGASLSSKYYNFVLIGSAHAPQHNRKEIEQILTEQIERGGDVKDDEVKRVRLATRNMLKTLENDAVMFGSILTDYVVSSEKGWQRYFDDIAEMENLTAKDVNAVYQAYFKPEQRIHVRIDPTPEEQKQAQTQKANTAPLKSTQQTEQAEPLKDVKEYQQEQVNYLKESKQFAQQIQSKLQKGKLNNGLSYTFYPIPLKDEKVYATLTLGISNHAQLKDKSVILSQMATQWVRGSQTHNLEQVIDKSLALNGTVQSSISGNRIVLNISADKQHFTEYLAFVLEMLQAPLFDDEDYEVNKTSALASLEQPYTEPEIVASLTMNRATEIYQEGDLFYHFEPELLKRQLNASNNAQVKQFFKDMIAMNHAQLVITGEFDSKKTQQLLQQTLGTWSNKQPYQRALVQHYPYSAQKIHVLAEQREFGHYKSYLSFPVGIEHEDGVALFVLSHILGGSQLSSRLAQELREKNNLVYGFDHSIDLSSVNNRGNWSVSANYQAGQAEQVSQAIHKTMQDLIEHGVTEQEVEQAKAHLLKGRISAIKDDHRVHKMLVQQMGTNRTLQNRLERDEKIAKITKAEIDKVIKKYFKAEHLVEVMADQYGKEIEFKPVQP